MKKKLSSSRSRPARPAWARAIERRLAREVRSGVPSLARQPRILRDSIVVLGGASPPASRLALTEQPFDLHLLQISPLYRRSRQLFLEGGGSFSPALVSSPRTLSSPILLTQRIEYSPIQSELIWAATDPGQKRDLAHLLRLRTLASSLFHEQSHRLLWRCLPPPALRGNSLGRYLNFVESLVIVLDMALGDELGPELAAPFYLSGVLYDPGTRIRQGLSSRDYRNYLQAALHATYLNLELYDPRAIPDAVAALFPMMPPELVDRASQRSLNLDRGFVTRTNPVWQKRHRVAVIRALARLKGKSWALPEDPLDNREQYLFAEAWMDRFGI